MEIQYDFEDPTNNTSDFDDFEYHSGLERCAFSPEDSGDGDDSESNDSDLAKHLPYLEKTESCVKRTEEDYEPLSQLIAAETEGSAADDWWEEAQREAEEMRYRYAQDRMLREREKQLRQMRANYQNATDSFSAFEEEEVLEQDWDEDSFGFNWRATKRAWLRNMPKSISTPSNFRIVRTCVTEPDVVEVIVDFRRSNEL